MRRVRVVEGLSIFTALRSESVKIAIVLGENSKDLRETSVAINDDRDTGWVFYSCNGGKTYTQVILTDIVEIGRAGEELHLMLVHPKGFLSSSKAVLTRVKGQPQIHRSGDVYLEVPTTPQHEVIWLEVEFASEETRRRIIQSST